MRVEDLSRRLGRVLALDRLSFTVDRGSLFGVLGNDGAGKSTLLHILSGQLKATRGRVFVLGCDVKEGLSAQRRVGTVSERLPLQKDLTLHQHVRLLADARGLPADEAEDRFDQLAERLFLTPDLPMRTGSLPAGARKRAAIALALLHQPELLLLDEPSTSLDVYDQLLFFDLFQELCAAGTTVVFTTSRPDEAEGCHRLLLLRAGRGVAEGSPLQLKMHHAAAIGKAAAPRSTAAIDRDARSTAAIDRDARSTAAIDRDARSAAAIDRDARCAAAIDLPTLAEVAAGLL